MSAFVIGVGLGRAAQLHFDGPFRAGNLPGVAVAQPLVGALDLPAVDDLLLEDAELVADAVADGGNLQRGHRVEEARGEAAQATVAEARLVLASREFGEVESQLADRLTHFVVDTEVQEVVAEMGTHQELCGEVGNGPRAVGV